jgi:ubiquinone/menaquinone biosynthesis C-methylase UbiE
MEDVAKVYDDQKIVNTYNELKRLTATEQTVLDKYYSRIAKSNFLDVGIGTGRTTYNFLDIVSHYIGTDISQQMIIAAKENFKNDNLKFLVSDARNMPEFENESIDVIFFSFNGIDHVEIDERILFFNEAKRILKKDGLLIFSSHNIKNIPSQLKFKYSLHPLHLYGNFIRYFKLRSHNKNLDFKDKQIIKFNDGAHNYRFSLTYIDPSYQKKSLESYGFKNISCFGTRSGKELNDHQLLNAEDAWIYYACDIN